MEAGFGAASYWSSSMEHALRQAHRAYRNFRTWRKIRLSASCVGKVNGRLSRMQENISATALAVFVLRATVYKLDPGAWSECHDFLSKNCISTASSVNQVRTLTL